MVPQGRMTFHSVVVPGKLDEVSMFMKKLSRQKLLRFVKRQWVLLLIGMVVIAGVLVYVILWLARPTQSSQDIFQTKPTHQAAPLTAQQATKLSEELTSGSESEVESAVALPQGQKLNSGVVQALASLGPITFDISTFHDNHDGTATITASIAHPTPSTSQEWTVLLLDVDGQWKISFTDPKT